MARINKKLYGGRMQFTVSVKRSGNRNHFMPEQLVYRRDRYWVRPCSLYLLTTATIASTQTSFGVRLLRIHFSPTWGRNECVTNEPQRTSAGRLQQQQQQFISVSSGSLFMYAEDTSIFCIGQSADSAIALLNKAL